jgi:hypothetical protein
MLIAMKNYPGGPGHSVLPSIAAILRAKEIDTPEEYESWVEGMNRYEARGSRIAEVGREVRGLLPACSGVGAFVQSVGDGGLPSQPGEQVESGRR